MLAIKLKRIGKKHQPSYRVVVTEKRSKLKGRYVEDLGWYNPMQEKDNLKIEGERVNYWMGNGAKPTDTVHNLLVRAGVLNSPKIPVHKIVVKKAEEEAPKEAASVQETAKVSSEVSSPEPEPKPEETSSESQ
ncbi:MAG: 30S ribosomal protein S16 [Candidatus Harrisonbacteria bacterium CG10_big_fil_rev_8_21_14_0_10_40_38]|uniref:Small ribosomal subunit protein bS16 n=1 Tax=Candidatus Harrisonbacteria bacterium CG10_big_fil_rev_8_21_14_0_10_40_38 TaxID=1974583 RepID=A0A2H0UT29_9BACT|nr:MAG: 30S ribosomal protein S16 [Candidatus Harrisonbacteria bacterium CG10_big_fil_rev_8_21_14_0_10_40_38]